MPTTKMEELKNINHICGPKSQPCDILPLLGGNRNSKAGQTSHRSVQSAQYKCVAESGIKVTLCNPVIKFQVRGAVFHDLCMGRSNQVEAIDLVVLQDLNAR